MTELKASWRAAFVAAVFLSTAAVAQPVRIAGSGANVGAIGLLIAEYRKANPTAAFAPVEALGSAGAIKAVAGGILDIALTSRPLAQAERSIGVREVEYARTPFVVVVRADSALAAISGPELARFMSGSGEAGPDGVRVRPVLRPAADIDTLLVKRMAPGVAPAIEQALKRPGMMVATTDKEAADFVERTAGAIGVSSLGLVLSESRRLRPLPLDGIAPTVAALESGGYPHHKRLFLVVSEKFPPSAHAKRFVEFVTSPAAKAVLRSTGHSLPPFGGA